MCGMHRMSAADFQMSDLLIPKEITSVCMINDKILSLPFNTPPAGDALGWLSS